MPGSASSMSSSPRSRRLRLRRIRPGLPAAKSHSSSESGDPNVPRPRRHRRSILGPFVLLVGVVGPVAGLVVLVILAPDSLPSVAPAPTAITMPVTITENNMARSASAPLTWHAGPSLLAPSWSGLVTAVHVVPGQRVTSGTSIVSVGGTDLIALASPQPFYRQIGPKTVGIDVEYLRTALGRLGIVNVGSGATYDVLLKSAIQQLDAKLTGIPAREASGVFDPGSVLYLQSDFVAASVDLQVGTMVPVTGHVIVASAQTLAPFSLAASSPQGVAPPLPSSSLGYVLVLADGTAIPLAAAGFGVTDPIDLQRVASAVGSGSPSLIGEVHLAAPVVVAAVPSTAVVSDASAAYCVFVVNATGLRALLVTPVGGLPGVTELTGLPRSIQSIVVNPNQVAAGRSCS